MRTKSSSKKSLGDQAAELVEQVQPHVEAARERIVHDYLPVAQSVLAEARDAAREVAQDARVAAQEAAANAEKSTRKSRKRAAKNARAKARSMAAAAAAAPAAVAVTERIKGKPKPRRKRRMMLLLGLLGAGTAVFKRLRSRTTSGASYTPSGPRPAPTPRPVTDTSTPQGSPDLHFGPGTDIPPSPASVAAPTGPSDPLTDPMGDAGPGGRADTDSPDVPPADKGGAFLDEVVADADEGPHKVTTPDHPAEAVDVSDVKDPKA